MNKYEKTMNETKNEKIHKIKLEQDNGTIFILKKISKKISKYLKISPMLFFKRGFVRLGSVLHIFLDHRKYQKKSKKKQTKILKKSQKKFKISEIVWKKKKKTRKKKTNATLQQLCRGQRQNCCPTVSCYHISLCCQMLSF